MKKRSLQLVESRIYGRVLGCAAALLSCAISAWATDRQVLRGHVPAAIKQLNLEPTSRLPATNHLHLAFGLPLRNSAALNSLLTHIYDPSSPEFRHYLTPDQFAQQFGPAEQDYEAVVAFLEAHGLRITARYPNRVLIGAEGSVADIESAFHVALKLYPHPKEARTFYAPDIEPSLDLSVPILTISGLNNYVLPHPLYHEKPTDKTTAAVTPLFGSGPGGTYMGSDFRQAYAPDVSLTGTGQAVGLLEFDGFYAKDITTYEGLAGLSRVRLKTVLLDGLKGSPGSANVEVALDIDMAMSMAPGLSAVIVYEGQLTDSILNQMATDNSASQLSASWSYPLDATSEQIFQQFAAQGQSFFNASGDADAWVGPVRTPSDDPYITIVGGTTLSMTTNGGSYISETSWNWGNGYGTGGGISTTYPIPSWQRGINMGPSQGSGKFRNLPDVAMISDNVLVVANYGSQFNVGGTSCATPLWAAFTALANQYALANGKPTVGFINPSVYSLGAGPMYSATFHDIVTGNNTNASSLTKFFAVPGYDLCTGWGTPVGQKTIIALAGTDGLSLTGAVTLAAVGPVGGPFTPTTQTVGVQNQGSSTLSWQSATDSTWLTVLPSAGSVSTSQPPTVVTLSLNAGAASLPSGLHAATVWFTNLNTGFIQARLLNLTIVQGAYGSAVMALNPIAYWQLNETSQVSPADVIVNSGALGSPGNGLGFGAPARGEPGLVGQSFRFSNPSLDAGFVGSHVDVPYNPALNPNGPFTVELWAEPTNDVPDFFSPASSVDSTQNGGNSRFGWNTYQTPGQHWEFRIGGINGYAVTNIGGPIQIGSWNHLVGVYDGTNASLYINGSLADGPTDATGFNANTNLGIPLRFGATTLTNRGYNGLVDEIAFYGTALNADQIAAHYEAGTNNPSGYAATVLADHPIGYWHLDEPPYSTPSNLPVAANIGSLGSFANGSYEPGSVPGMAGIPSLAFGQNNGACLLENFGYLDMAAWALDSSGPLSLALWVKASPSTGLPQNLATRGIGSCRLVLDGSGYPHFTDGEQPFGELVGPGRIDDATWHQLIGVYDGTNTESLYVDGQLAATTSGATNAVLDNGNDLFIGASADGGLFPMFNGVVDEVAIFTSALTGTQVQQLFAAAAFSPQTPPVFKGIAREVGAVRLVWTSVPGKSYQVQYKSSLNQTTWNNLGTAIIASTGTLELLDPFAGNQRFYRVVVLP